MVEKMKTSKKAISFGLIILLSLLIVGVTTTQAKKPVGLEITFVYTWDSYDAAKKEWTTDKGILHTLQTPHYGHVTEGDITGDIYYCGNLILDLATLSGKGGGIFEFTGLYNGEAAGFRGKMIFEIKSLVLTGTLNCPGTGAFANMLFKGTVDTIIIVSDLTYVTLVVWN